MNEQQLTLEGLKFCKMCGKYKPISEFYRNNHSKDKHDYRCKECTSKYLHEYKAKHTDELKAYKKTYYASQRAKLIMYSMNQYYSTDYLEKKYLKRYQSSLEKVLAKKADLEENVKWKEGPTRTMKQRMAGYESAIERWKTKIREAKELIALYAENKAKDEAEKDIGPSKQCPRCGKTKPLSEFGKDASRSDGTQSCCKECAREKTRLCRSKASNTTARRTKEPLKNPSKKEHTMTKEQLIALLAEVPDNAQIIYVGDTDSRSNLIATWRTDEHSVCIRNLSTDMPYIITEGKLYDLVSASIPFADKNKREEI